MKSTTKFISLFLLTLCFVNITHASAKIDHYNNFQSVNCFIECENVCIDQVIVNEQGVFLLVDGCWIKTQGMQATQNAILVLENEVWISLSEALRSDNYYVWRCPICGTWNVQNGEPCSNSRNHPK